MKAVGEALIGKNRLVDLEHVNKIYVSPRLRAQMTLKLLLEYQEEEYPVHDLNITTVSNAVLRKSSPHGRVITLMK